MFPIPATYAERRDYDYGPYIDYISNKAKVAPGPAPESESGLHLLVKGAAMAERVQGLVDPALAHDLLDVDSDGGNPFYLPVGMPEWPPTHLDPRDGRTIPKIKRQALKAGKPDKYVEMRPDKACERCQAGAWRCILVTPGTGRKRCCEMCNNNVCSLESFNPSKSSKSRKKQSAKPPAKSVTKPDERRVATPDQVDVETSIENPDDRPTSSYAEPPPTSPAYDHASTRTTLTGTYSAPTAPPALYSVNVPSPPQTSPLGSPPHWDSTLPDAEESDRCLRRPTPFSSNLPPRESEVASVEFNVAFWVCQARPFSDGQPLGSVANSAHHDDDWAKLEDSALTGTDRTFVESLLAWRSTLDG